MFRRKVESIDDVLKQALRKDGLETPLQQRQLIKEWGKISGPIVENYTANLFIRNQTLFVKLLNPALRADLSMMKSALVKKLNAKVGRRVITDIHFY
jgi:predicted nucleic acid-binding Zn ribbon protein